MARIAVIGGGIAGLAAARTVALAGHDVLLFEASPTWGGKLRGHEVAGVLVDVGAEAMLNRRPEGVELARAVGIDVVHPAIVSSRIWTGGELKRLPRTLMGVPLDVEDLADTGILSASGLEHVRRERDLPATVFSTDISVGDLVDRRFGSEVTDLLVEPLLGGVYAGHARLISALAAVPQLVAMAERGSVLDQAPVAPPTYAAPVFAGIEGGMSRLPAALVDDLAARGVDLHVATTIRELHRHGDGFVLVGGPTTNNQTWSVEGVIVATPPTAAARLLAPIAPVASTEISRIESASMAVVTFAFAADELPELAQTDSSGFLVPPVEGRRIKASTFSFAKWTWVREAGLGAGPHGEDLLFLRTSLGRHGDERSLQVSDNELVATSLLDLLSAARITARPVDVHVQRWGGGLPQYALGHLDRVARAHADVEAVPGLAVCGAAYEGVGIPAVIGSADRAAAQVLKHGGTMAP